jgi:predicted flavoprotein YhiN
VFSGNDRRPRIAVIGAGPAGLAAAEAAAEAGAAVVVFDRMPSPARKFLIAGRGGLNLTHSELLDRFLSRFADADARLLDAVRAFPPEAVARWCEGLGQPVFTGSSGRVFPVAMKASPLLRAWLSRLDSRP